MLLRFLSSVINSFFNPGTAKDAGIYPHLSAQYVKQPEGHLFTCTRKWYTTGKCNYFFADLLSLNFAPQTQAATITARKNTNFTALTTNAARNAI